jgi:tRNA (guanine37-N1)-methyltransferase
MRFDILTLFPEMLHSYLAQSILKRAQAAQLIQIELHNIREWATDKHHMTDDTPFGGGGGMVMKPEPTLAAIQAVRQAGQPVILMTPQGRLLSQRVAQELTQYPGLVLVCGRYEGFDERIRTLGADDEISIGDYVLTGGELPALILVDTIARLIPGVLGAEQGAAQDSHATGLLEHPHYTRPAMYEGLAVPAILQGGDHAAQERWRKAESLRRTWQRRPDLLLAPDLHLSEKERWLLADFAAETLSNKGLGDF